MAPVIYLHIGAMKTGTTFLQRLMRRHRVDLDGVGVLFPGRTWREQSYGVREILDRTLDDPVLTRRCRGAWARVSEEMLAYDGRSAVLSMEFLSQATPDQVQRVVDTFAARGAEVHVVLTVRDTTRMLPAHWQTLCRTGGRVSWPDFLHSARTLAAWRPASGKGAESFAKAQDVPATLQRWCQVVSPEKVHVVTVPPSSTDPLLLWKRFASVIGVDPTVCWRVPGRSNPSLGHPSAELMRLINVELGPVRISDSSPVLKHYLAKEVLARRADHEHPIGLDRAGLRFAARWNRRTVRAIEARQVHLVGDLTDLPTRVTPEARAGRVRRLRNPTTAELLAAAVTAHDGLRQWLEDRGGPPVPSGKASDLVARWRAQQADPVQAAVVELAGLARSAMALGPPPRVASPTH
jgi:hypothetical protein